MARRYVSAPPGPLPKPVRELKAFAKTALLVPGASQKLTFALTPADLASYDTGAPAWVADAGTYAVPAGASSLAIKQQATFQLPQAVTTEKSRHLLAPAALVAALKPYATAR